MKYELLKPDTLCAQLKIWQGQLEKVRQLKLKTLKLELEGHLRIAQANGGHKIQYYHFTDSKNLKGKYIPYSNLEFARQLAQKDYDKKLIKILEKQIVALNKYILLSENKINEIYNKMPFSRQQLVVPITLTNEQFIQEWKKVTWQGLPFKEKQPAFTTANGELVRSKSEEIIADTLKRMRIPYRYEYPLDLKDGRTLYPDFTCLNIHNRKEFYWEHFGMLDDPDYLERTIQKLKLYNEKGIIPGKNLIITIESKTNPINLRQIETPIREFLKE